RALPPSAPIAGGHTTNPPHPPPHRRRPPLAISSIGALPTPAVGARGRGRSWPASANLHRSGPEHAQHTRGLKTPIRALRRWLPQARPCRLWGQQPAVPPVPRLAVGIPIGGIALAGAGEGGETAGPGGRER